MVYWLISVGRFQGRAKGWDSVKCTAPSYLEDRIVGSLLEEQLICDENEKASQFKLNPDILFKKVIP